MRGIAPAGMLAAPSGAPHTSQLCVPAGFNLPHTEQIAIVAT